MLDALTGQRDCYNGVGMPTAATEPTTTPAEQPPAEQPPATPPPAPFDPWEKIQDILDDPTDDGALR